jgi:hypothetical protein
MSTGPDGVPTVDTAQSDPQAGPSGKRSFTERLSRTRDILRAPRVAIELYGDDEARAVFNSFTSRHPRFIFTSAKRWGVALLRLPDSADTYLAKGPRLPRRRRKHAESAGYRYERVPPLAHLDDIVELNTSAPSRQGRPMAARFRDREYLAATVGAHSEIHAIFDAEDRLRAYAVIIDIGDAFTFSAMIGHAGHLHNGIMYLLMGEVVRFCVASRRPDGEPSWLVYDTLWGASPGLAFFKERTGFRPFTVRWVWLDRTSKSGAPS